MQGNMKMDPPFVTGGLGALESNIKIAIALNSSIVFALNYLVKINVIRKGLQGLPHLGGGLDFESGAYVNLADPDLVVLKAFHDGPRLFKLDGQMAGVVVDAEELIDSAVARPRFSQTLEKSNSLFARFQKAKRLWLKTEVERLAGALTELRNMINTVPKVLAHGLHLLVAADKFFERTGNSADASFHSGRE